VAFGQSEPLERADVAAAEDGRTLLNTCARSLQRTFRTLRLERVHCFRCILKIALPIARTNRRRSGAGVIRGAGNWIFSRLIRVVIWSFSACWRAVRRLS
jgi:hypothetical protein